MEKEALIYPSILSADFLHLASSMSAVIKAGIKTIHYDIMDGLFVRDISFGEKLFKVLYDRYHKKLNFDIHLMTEEPYRHIRQLLALGGSDFTFHYENTINKLQEVNKLRDEYPYIKLGIAISPETDVSRILGLANNFDNVLVMSVVPGASGQSFIPQSLEKIKRLALLRKETSASFKIGVDGGINDKTAFPCIEAGADYLVTGSYFFAADDKEAALKRLVK